MLGIWTDVEMQVLLSGHTSGLWLLVTKLPLLLDRHKTII